MLYFPSNNLAIADQPRLKNGLEFHDFNQSDVGRSSVEQKIVDAYHQQFGANLEHFMPTLVSANLPGQDAHLSFGVSAASEHTLFLENYLSMPVEQALSGAVNKPIERSEIIEIGNLAFSHTDRIQDDLIAIANYCYDLGYRYVVCTATRMLRLIFARSGVKPVYLGGANIEDAPCDNTHWGKYYQSSPKIICGNIMAGIEQLLDVQKQP